MRPTVRDTSNRRRPSCIPPTVSTSPPSSVGAEGTCVSISKLKRFGTKHFPDAKIQNGFRTGLLTEETSLPDRSYNIDTGPCKSIGTSACDNRAKTSHQFRSKSSRMDSTPPPTKLAPGVWEALCVSGEVSSDVCVEVSIIGS